MLSKRVITMARCAPSRTLVRHTKKRLVPNRFYTASQKRLAPEEVKIMFGTQTGTSQLFAMQLADELMSSNVKSVKVSSLADVSPTEMISKEDGKDDALVFLLSCCGVGQPPDNAKEFVSWVNSDLEEVKNLVKGRKYATFGLGNGRTHAENYNVVGKKFDKRMEELGAKRIHGLGLGDDSGCIEDDFDEWSQSLIETLNNLKDTDDAVCSYEPAEDGGSSAENTEPICLGETELKGPVCQGELHEDQTQNHPPSNFPDLVLEDYPRDRLPLRDLFDLDGETTTPFYMPGTRKLKVLYNNHIAPNRESLREMSLSLEDHPELFYQVGDHLWIYPQNHPSQVAAYAKAVNANPFSVIKGVQQPQSKDGKDEGRVGRPYPMPFNLTVAETLQHCVDLSALPSPTLARFILGKKIDYKSYVAAPRRTTLDLLSEPGSRKLTLSELLFQLPPMAPRYYSISSSPESRPREILITFRPVKYYTQRGTLREGVCTAFLKSCRPAYDNDEDGSHKRVFSPYVAAGIRSNPEFRLPSDPKTPLLLVAGGCGIAPIRSFLDERLALTKSNQAFGDAHLFFGVRTNDDEVYHSLIDHALQRQALTSAHISHSSSCTNPRFVASDIEDQGAMVYDCLERGGHVYLCGGAVGFAPTCAAAIKSAIAKYGNMSEDEAEAYYMDLVHGGRYAEDISE